MLFRLEPWCSSLAKSVPNTFTTGHVEANGYMTVALIVMVKDAYIRVGIGRACRVEYKTLW